MKFNKKHCIIFILLPIFVLSVYYSCFSIWTREIDSIADCSCPLPDYLVCLPSKGKCRWTTLNVWADKHVIYGKHKGISEMLDWRNTVFIKNNFVPQNVLDLNWAHNYSNIQFASKEWFYENVLEPNLKKSVSYDGESIPFQYAVGTRLISWYIMDGNGRRYFDCFITDEYFFLYFSHM